MSNPSLKLQFIRVYRKINVNFGIITHFYYLIIFKIPSYFTHSFAFDIDEAVVNNHGLIQKCIREEEHFFFRSGVALINLPIQKTRVSFE